MNEEEQTRKLIRLKRHETPREGYFEDFLNDFRERHRPESSSQRQALAAGLFMRWRDSRSAVRMLGFGLVYGALVAALVWLPKGNDDDADGHRQPVIYEPDAGGQPTPGPEAKSPRSFRD